MIPKGNQRGGGQQLATHLLNALDNERAQVLDIRGAVAQDLHGAFKEWRAIAQGTKCTKYLYSLSINPDPGQRALTREEFLDYIARVEASFGLENQPRAIVVHVKEGREHFHTVWSRIDAENMRAVQLSFDRQKLRTLTQEFALEHGLRLPPGLSKDRGTDRFNDRARGTSLAEKQQEERSGISKEQRRADVTAAWKLSDTSSTFLRALEERGYYLAQGDRRAYVIVDRFGEIHSLTRQIEGAKAKDVAARLADLPLDKLPHASRAQEFIRTKLEKQAVRAFQIEASQRWLTLRQSQQKRRTALDQKRKATEERHRTQQKALLAKQVRAAAEIETKRRERESKGLSGFFRKVTGINALIRKKHERQDKTRNAKDLHDMQTLKRRQQRELQDLKQQGRALTSVERREARSLRTKIKREQFRGIIHAHEQEREGPQLTPSQKTRLREFIATGREISQEEAPTPSKTTGRTGRSGRQTDGPEIGLEQIKQTGQEIVRPPAEAQPTLTDSFAEALRRRVEEKKAAKERDRNRGGGREFMP